MELHDNRFCSGTPRLQGLVQRTSRLNISDSGVTSTFAVNILRPGAGPTNAISIEFEIRSKFGML